jgi:hypothetical protein
MKTTAFCMTRLMLFVLVHFCISMQAQDWRSRDTIFLDTLYIDIEHGNAKDPTTGRGMIGGGGFYHAIMGVAPTCEIINDSLLNIILNNGQMKYKVIERHDPGGLALLGWSFDLMDAENGPRYVKMVKVVYDSGEDSLAGNGGNYTFVVPEGAGKLIRVEVSWEWFNNKTRFAWTTGSRFPWWTSLFLIPVIGAIYYFKKKKKNDKDEPLNWTLNFTGVEPDVSIQNANPFQVVFVKAQAHPKDPSQKLPEQVTVNIINTNTGILVPVVIKPENPGDINYTSGPVYLNSKEFPSEFEFKEHEIIVSIGNLLTAILEKQMAPLPITDPLPEPTPLKGFHLINHGKQSITVDPENNLYEQLAVRFTNSAGKPVVGERIVWMVETYSEAPVSITDEDGVAVLNFEPDDIGKFTATMDGLPLVEHFVRGHLKITVAPENEIYMELMETDVVNLEAHLIAPTIVQIIDHTYAPVFYIIGEQKYGFRVILGDRDEAANSGNKELTAIYTDIDGDTSEITLPKTQLDRCYENADFEVIKCSINDSCKPLYFEWNGTKIELFAYAGNVYMVKHTNKRFLEALNTALTNALNTADGNENEDEGIEELEVRHRMVQNALKLYELPSESTAIINNAANAYMELIKLPSEQLGEQGSFVVYESAPRIVRDLNLQFTTTGERDAINSAISTGVYEMDNFIWQAYSTFALDCAELIFAPVFGGYVCISGKTITGEKASFLERVLGGLAALGSIATVLGPFMAYARAAKVFSKVANYELSFTKKTLETLLKSKVLRVEALKAAEIVSEFSRTFKRVKDAVRRVNNNLQQAENGLIKVKDELAAAERELLKKESKYKSMLQRSRPTSKHMVRRQNTIRKYREETIPRKQQVVAEAEDNLLEARMKAEQYRTEILSQEEQLLKMKQAGMLPHRHQRFGDYSAQWLYQNQNQAGFMREGKMWVGEKTIPVANRYNSVNWKRAIRQDVSPRGPVTRMDHINLDPKTHEMADTKYFVGWPKENASSMAGFKQEAKDFVEDRVLQCTESIEKARVTQFELLKKHYGATKSDGAIWKEVFDLPVMIVTPEKVPDYFERLIKSRIMRCGQNLSFFHVPARLDVWERTLRGLRSGIKVSK